MKLVILIATASSTSTAISSSRARRSGSADPGKPGRYRQALQPRRLPGSGRLQPVRHRARAVLTWRALNAINEKMRKALAQAGGRHRRAVLLPAPGRGQLHRRKPKPGMFEDIARRFNISLAGVASIGDSLRDVQAGVRGRRATRAGAHRQRGEDPARPAGCPTAPRCTRISPRPCGRSSHEPGAGGFAPIVFLPMQAALTVVWSISLVAHLPVSCPLRATASSRLVADRSVAGEVICGVAYEVRGLENLPQRPSIVLAKHQLGRGKPSRSRYSCRRRSGCCADRSCACLSSAGAWR